MLTICVLATLNNKSRFTLPSYRTRRDARMLVGYPQLSLRAETYKHAGSARPQGKAVGESKICDKRPQTCDYEPDRNTVRRLHRGVRVKDNGYL
jgi:hypothetical protein